MEGLQMNFKLPEIKRGMTLKCFKCRQPILVNDETFTADCAGEYISCPYCKTSYDVQMYHKFGEEIKD